MTSRFSRIAICWGILLSGMALGVVTPQEVHAQTEKTCDPRGPGGAPLDNSICGPIAWTDVSSANYVGLRSQYGELTQIPVDVPRTLDGNTVMACRFVDDMASYDIFVPFRTPEEWSSFLNMWDDAYNPGTPMSTGKYVYARLVKCARRTMGEIKPHKTCSTDSTTTPLPYSRVQSPALTYPSGKDVSSVFMCDSGDSFQIVWPMWRALKVSGDSVPTSWPYWNYDTSGWVEGTFDYITGTCGPADGVPRSTAPVASDPTLCSGSGVMAKDISGSGPWSWVCYAKGTDSTMAELSCNAPVAAPKCGKADGVVYSSTPPSSSLCSVGVASGFSSTNPWAWTCKSGPLTASCATEEDTSSSVGCGPAAGQEYETAPTADLCPSGSKASSVTHVDATSPYWQWTCSGGGKKVVCTAVDCGC
ncbi:MAG: hypothetical protein PHE27_02840 [Alphaproteobacteria bacterium]|nr:hypothetical protein [Alphaproteobacteria bacterium]